MTQRDSEGIGGIGRESTFDFEHCTHHVRDLHFLGAAETHRSELDGSRRVFGDLETLERRQGCTACLPELERTVDVATDEDFFDGNLLRRMLNDEISHPRVQAREARNHGQTVHLDTPVGDAARLGTHHVDDAETETTRTGIDAEDAAIDADGRRRRLDRPGRFRSVVSPGLGPITRHALATPEIRRKNDTRMIAETPSAGSRSGIRSMQIAEPISDAMQRALERATSTLRAADFGHERLAEAMPAARLVGALTDDVTLAAAVLLHEAAAETLPEKAPEGFEIAAFSAAQELARLGDFGNQAQWRDGERLDEAQAEVLRKMLLAIVADPRLVIARIGIQLARLRVAKALPETARRRLAGEARAVFGPLANRLGVWQIKWELEDLAFRYLEPEQYKAIAGALAERRADRERYIADLRTEINDLLAREGLHAEVYGRPKHIFSIHRKMQRKGLSFEQLFDVRAVRIVCASVPDCYAALGAVHGRWTYIPGEFDDYIATPKDNFYRSIHTAVIGPGGKSVEIQIRTREMNEQAELGVAAHWRYKEDGPRDASYERKIEWVRQLLEPAEPGATSNDPDFIDRVRAELFEDRVYALTPRGEVIDLPRGATPLDFAYQVHTSLGHRCRGAKVNGRIVQLTQALANGQVVEIITGKHESPSRDWLIQEGYLASPRSRAKLRSWFRRVDAGENEAAGRVLVERELSRLGITLEHVSALANELKAHDSAQLFRWLGEGEVTVTQLLQAAARLAPGPARTADADVHARPSVPAKTRRSRKTPSAAASRSPVKIEGVGDLPMTFAKCCAPVPPEAVLGYVTLGRGVTVHAARCASLLRMRATHPERCLRVDWSEDDSATIAVELSIVAWDRRGLVRDLSDLVATANLSLESLQTTTDRTRGTATTILRTRVRDLAQLADLSRRLSAVDNVISVRRSA